MHRVPTTVRTRRRLLGAALPLVAMMAIVAACVPPTNPGPTTSTSSTSTTSSTTTTLAPRHVMSIGHADAFEVTVDGAALELLIKDDSGPTPVFRDPAETILHAKAESQITLPNPPGAFAFLGAGGASVWMLPQVQNPNLLWPGSSTERIAPGTLQGNKVDWTIMSVDGPGGLHVFQNGAFGAPNIWFTTGAAMPQTKQLSVPSHVHYNWGFTATGTYTVVAKVSGTLADGTPVVSPPTAYTFHVGEL